MVYVFSCETSHRLPHSSFIPVSLSVCLKAASFVQIIRCTHVWYTSTQRAFVFSYVNYYLEFSLLWERGTIE